MGVDSASFLEDEGGFRNVSMGSHMDDHPSSNVVVTETQKMTNTNQRWEMSFYF